MIFCLIMSVFPYIENLELLTNPQKLRSLSWCISDFNSINKCADKFMKILLSFVNIVINIIIEYCIFMFIFWIWINNFYHNTHPPCIPSITNFSKHPTLQQFLYMRSSNLSNIKINRNIIYLVAFKPPK